MKESIAILLALLLSCHCSSEIKVDQNLKEKTQSTDQNADVIYQILSELDLNKLVNIVDVEPSYSAVVSHIFGRKYPEIELRLSTKYPDSRTHFKSHSEQEFLNYFGNEIVINNSIYADKLIITNFEFANKIFKYFGKNIQKISINDGNLELNDLQRIYRLVNKCCSETLRGLEIKSYDNHAFEEFTVPFKTVEELKFFTRIQNFSETRPLNQLFPQLRRLGLEVIPHTIPSFINCNLPYLEHLKIHNQDSSEMNVVKEIIMKNPTIRTFEAEIYPPGLIEFINQHLPQIESLKLRRLNETENHLVFENVKKLILDQDTVFNKLWFPRLKSLRMHYNHSERQLAVDFFNRHTQLTFLDITQYFSENNGQMNLNYLTANLPNLVELRAYSKNLYATEDIIQFVKNHEKLKKCRLESYSPDFESYSLEMLQQRLEDQWNIEGIIGRSQAYQLEYYAGYIMEKKPIKSN